MLYIIINVYRERELLLLLLLSLFITSHLFSGAPATVLQERLYSTVFFPYISLLSRVIIVRPLARI